jgi:excisionase family DNA binding protein
MQTPSDNPTVLTVAETAKLLRIGRNVAYEAIARGEIPSIRVGRRVLVPIARLRRLLDGEPATADVRP